MCAPTNAWSGSRCARERADNSPRRQLPAHGRTRGYSLPGMSHRLLLFACLIVTVVLVACGEEGEGVATTAEAETANELETSTITVTEAEKPKETETSTTTVTEAERPADGEDPSANDDYPKRVRAQFMTACTIDGGESQCLCALEKIEEQLSLKQFAIADELALNTGQIPLVVQDAFLDCG